MYVIGLDIGTSGTKALLVDETGKVLSTGYKSYPLFCNGNCVEQDAHDWWSTSIYAVKEALKGYDATEVVAMSLSTQGASMVAVDDNNEPIGNVITWMDTRTQPQADILEKALGFDYFYLNTGWQLSPILDASKILYMKGNEKYKSAKAFLSTMDFLNLKLTGNSVIDYTNAGIRQLLNIKKRTWDKNILNVLKATESELPQLSPTGTFVGTLTKDAAQALGLSQQVKVFNGAQDQYCASIGAGATKAGDLYLSTGTTWALMGVSDNLIFTKSHVGCSIHPINGLYGAMASLSCSGAALQWFKDEFITDDFSTIDSICSTRRESAKDIFFMPYMAGSCYPLWSKTAKGGFIGLTLANDKFDMALSIMEGVAFATKDAVKDYAESGCTATSLSVMGGGAKSKLWMSVLQAVTQLPLYTMDEVNTCPLGAAMIALCAIGVFKDYEEAAKVMVKKTPVPEAKKDIVDFYQNKYNKFSKNWEFIEKCYEE